MERKIKKQIITDLNKKMVFIVGPRQVGKTWLAKDIAKSFNRTVYLNYDNSNDREIIENEMWLIDSELVIFDEIHKMPNWKNYLKGVYDTKPENMKILVTGSARLDAFRQAGDSLAGRFFTHRLLPFSYKEIFPKKKNIKEFIACGGFPEPFLAENETEVNRWRKQYVDSLIRNDVLDFENVHNFKAISLILELLQKRVGSPISFQSIAEDIKISPNTVKKYIQILETLFIVFRITPFSKNIARSLLKEPKIYFYDNGMVKGDDGAKFENFIANSLLKQVWGEEDSLGTEISLHYLRTKDKKEVDFCIVKNSIPQKIIEVKLSDKNLSRELFYFHSKYQIPASQIVLNLKTERRFEEITLRKAELFLSELDY